MTENSLGRTYALWLAAGSLGWTSRVHAGQPGATWVPLRGTEFESECFSDAAELARAAKWADVVVAVKPLPLSFARAMWVSRTFYKPLLLDIDDPDLDARLEVHSPLRAAAKWMLRPRAQAQFHRLSRALHKYPKTFSNPALARRYGGGVIVPHARDDLGFGAPHTSVSPRVVFVGTNRPHKGVEMLRGAVRRLSAVGYTLTVTDVPPPDAAPWEKWIGETTLTEGRALVAAADIVVIPSSRRSRFAHLQLPAKLADAMLAGRAVLVADLEPLVWAVGDPECVVPADDVDALAGALAGLRDPAYRSRKGEMARARALDMFTTSRVAESWAGAVHNCLESWSVRPHAQ